MKGLAVSKILHVVYRTTAVATKRGKKESVAVDSPTRNTTKFKVVR